MSEPWTPEQRRAAFVKAGRREIGADDIGKLVGCALGLVALILMVAAMGAIVVKLWRMALGG